MERVAEHAHPDQDRDDCQVPVTELHTLASSSCDGFTGRAQRACGEPDVDAIDVDTASRALQRGALAANDATSTSTSGLPGSCRPHSGPILPGL